MTQPANFLPSPSPGTGPLAHGAPLRLVEAPGAAPLVPVLTVRPNGDVTLAKPLLSAVPQLRAGCPVDVVPPNPKHRGGPWHLDARPTATRRLPRAGVMRFRIVPPSRTHFLRPALSAVPGQFGGAQGTAGFRPALVFALGPEVPGAPGYFVLLPVK